MTKRLRTWLFILLAFLAGWAAEAHWQQGKLARKAVTHAHGSEAYANAKNGSAFSASYANAVQGNDKDPKMVAWSADSALGKILAATKGGQRTLAIAGLVSQTSVEQLGALIDQARFCNDDSARQSLLDMAYAKWATADPQAALSFARTAATKRFDKDSGPLSQVLSTWAGHDPQAALAAAQGVDLISLRQDGIRSVLAAWGAGPDPQAAITAAKSLSLGNQLGPALNAIYSSWAENNPNAAFGALDQITNLNTRSSLAGSILQTMADRDPRGALSLLESLPAGAQDNPPNPINTIFASLTSQNPSAAVSALNEIPGGAMRERAVSSIASNWADSNPQGALAWASSLSNPADRENAMNIAIQSMSGNDPADAAAQLKNIPDVNQRNQTMNNVLSNWADRDPAAALQWTQQNTTGNAQTMALSQIVNNVASTDPLAALGIVQQIGDTPNHNSLVFQTINSWAQSDPSAALAWAGNNLTGTEQSTAQNLALRQLINIDPAAGANYVASMPDGQSRSNLISQVATSMASTDLDGALSWINSTQGINEQTRDNAIQNVMSNFEQVDPASAAQKLASLNIDTSTPGGQNTYSTIAGQIASGWADSDPTAALNWASSLSGPARQDALSSTLTTVANSDPAAAWDIVMSMSPDDPAESSLVGSVANSWARSDPASATSLLGDLDPAQLVNTVGTLSNSWLREDPQAASEWIDTLPASPARDVAVQNLINTQGQYDLTSGLAWAATISSDTGQTRAYNTLIAQAARRDPAAAQNAVNGAANLTDEQRQALTQLIQRTPQTNLNQNAPTGYHWEFDHNGNRHLVQD
jgi:hypothetical protein